MGYRVETVITGSSGAPFFSRMNFLEMGTEDPAAEAAAACFAVGTFWQAMSTRLVDELSWSIETDVTQYQEGTGQTLAVWPSGGQNGTFVQSNGPLPWSNQVLIRWFTGVYFNGRQVRGRTFVPGAAVTYISNGQPNTDLKGTVSGAAQGLIDDPDCMLGVLSRGTTYPVTSESVWDRFAVLTSRRD